MTPPRESRSVFDRVGRLASFLGDPRVPKLPRFAVIAAVAYLLSPIDLVPEAILPIIGYMDDVGILWLALRWLSNRGEQATETPPQVIDVTPQRRG